MSAPGPVPTPELPSARRLLRSTLIAAVVAAAILFTIVLPAEYGIDPTGVGRVLGLKEMGDIKVALAIEEADDHAAEALAKSQSSATQVGAPMTAGKSDVTELTLPPGAGKEIKLSMADGARVTYSWSTNRGVVNYDAHADSPTIKYHGYAKRTAVNADSGSIVAAFDGQHGWLWRNRGNDTITVTLRTSGDYRELKRMP